MREDHTAPRQTATAGPEAPVFAESAADRPSGIRPGAARRSSALTVILWVLRLVTAAALAVDAYVHADLAPGYDFTGGSITQGNLFRAEAGAAALAALLLIVAGRRALVWVFVFLVAAAGLAAVLLYRYVDVGAFGPFSNMYEPFWYAEKTRSAIAEAIGTGTALIGLLLTLRMSMVRSGRIRGRSGPGEVSSVRGS